jgi:hypothetical protein
MGAWVFRVGAIVIVASLVAAFALPVFHGVFLFISTLGAWMAFYGGIMVAPKGEGRWFDIDDDV